MPQLARTTLAAARRCLPLFAAALLAALLPAAAFAQTTVVFPSTITSIAGSSPVATTATSACAANSPFTASDTVGDGCPALNATLSGAEKAIALDPQGNVYFASDTNNPQYVRRIDARSGLVTVFAGFGANGSSSYTPVTFDGTVYAPVDKEGDGLPVVYSGGFYSTRGLGSDPYGNIFIGTVGSNILHVVCTAASPLCSASEARVNLLKVVAGCTTAATAYGTAVVGTTVGTAGDGGPATQLLATSCTIGTHGAASVVADAWDNVYFMDRSNGRIRVVAGAASITTNGTTRTNPLTATLLAGGYTLTQGYIYPIAGGGTVCSGKTDSGGDGCLFTQTVINTGNSGATVQGLAVDPEGDFIFDDGNGYLRVIYAGGTAIQGALTALGIPSPVVGNSYRLIGGGTTYYYNSGIPNPILGSAFQLQSQYQTLAVDPASNLYISDQLQVLFLDIRTGYVRRIATSSGAASCNSSSVGDGCPLSQSLFGVASTALPIAMDVQGNLYMIDAASTTGHKLIRRVTATLLPTTALNGSQTSSLLVHAPASGSTVALTLPTSPDYSLGTTNCVTNSSSDNSVDCTAAVTFAPTAPGLRAVPLFIDTTVASTTTHTQSQFAAASTGSALVFDAMAAPAATALTGSTGITALGLDASGSLYTAGSTGIQRLTPASASLTSSAPAYFAVDPAGSVYATAAGATTITRYTPTRVYGTYSTSTISLPQVPLNGSLTQAYGGPLAVDANGVLYLADTTNRQLLRITQNPLQGQQLTPTALTGPTALTQDPYGNLILVDGTALLTIPASGVPLSTANTSPVANPTLTLPASFTGTLSGASLASDAAGDLYIVSGVSVYVRTAAGTGYYLPLAGPVYVNATTSTLTLANATDTLSGTLSITGSAAAHSLTVSARTTAAQLVSLVNADTTFAAEGVTASLSGSVITFAEPATTLSFTGTALTEALPLAASVTAVAVDGAGNLALASSTSATVYKLLRGAATHNFGTDVSDPYVGVLLNTGNTAATGLTQTDTGGNYSFLAPATSLDATASTCVPASTALFVGADCNTSITFAPSASGNGDTPDRLTLLPAGNTLGALSLDGLKNGSTATTTTAISGTTAGLVYSTGTEATFTVTVTQSSGAPSGVVSVSLDGASGVNYTLGTATGSSASATVTLAALAAGSHTLAATYAGSSGIAGSSTLSPTSFSIAQAGTTVSWTPATTSIQFSAPLGLAVLNATAKSGATTVPGTMVYTANGAEVHSASYLARGNYALTATFYPTDSVDYSGSTGSVASFNVVQATTTAPIGGSQLVVGPTGNYASVQAAINALPVTGGSVYIQPGTYTGDLTVTQPNVALRGLGGDPTQVILTHSGGALSNNPGSVYNYAGEFTTALSNGFQLPSGSSLFSGDQGSATLVVARGINTAVSSSTTTPNGFYGEGFTLQNTWNTDPTTTTTYVSGGVCSANAGPATSYSALYNAGTECASQALAIWITSDNAVLNNVYTASLQDTVYAGAISTGSGYPARQLWFRGKVTGDVDYIFGDAAAVFDHTSIYSAFHSTAGGTVTIQAQNQAQQAGSGSYYLSGYVMNSAVFTSQNSGMSNLYFGRPYGTYSTWIMLNSYIDQVNPAGYIPFSGSNALTYATYGEYNDHTYTDPANGAPDLNGVPFLGTSGASTGTGVLPTSARESASIDPGITAFNANTTNSVGMTQPQAQPWYPLNFLGRTIATSSYNTVATWDPTAALAADANAFVPASSPTSIAYGQPITLLMRPQTPGLGAVANGTYTLPTGTYTLTDTLNSVATVIATGSLDSAGQASFLTSTLAPGVHSFTWSYGGDANFVGSQTTSAYALTVTALATHTTVATTSTPTYGQSASITATVTATGATPTGQVALLIDGTSTLTGTLSSGSYTFTVTGLSGGNHSFSATYTPGAGFSTSTTASNLQLSVAPATLTVAPTCSNRIFGAPTACSVTFGTFQYSDNAAAVFSSTPAVTTTALRNSPANSYPVTLAPASLALTSAGSLNYTLSTSSSNFTITGGAPQTITFPQLPSLPAGTYQLTATASSGLAVSYVVTAGNGYASISGTTLTITGSGTVTVQATQATDPTGDYAAASPVSVTFLATGGSI